MSLGLLSRPAFDVRGNTRGRCFDRVVDIDAFGIHTSPVDLNDYICFIRHRAHTADAPEHRA